MYDDYENKCKMILEWAENKRFFDTSVIEGILEWIEEDNELTNSQMQAIDNIINGFGIDL